MLQLRSSSAVAIVDPAAGGRLASLAVEGRELLVGQDSDTMRWGSYPMVPFAGRIRGGRFSFEDIEYALPANLGPHAIHGYGYTSRWNVVDDHTIGWAFSSPWPFAGHARQRFELTERALAMVMTATAHERQPVMLGWHPWFRRDIGSGAGIELSFGPASMYELDDAAIPTGRLVAPPDGPWDNCFTALERQPTLRWGDALEVELRSSADHWVVFTEPDHAICVEPQTEAPDAVNRAPRVLEAGESLQISFEIAWA